MGRAHERRMPVRKEQQNIHEGQQHHEELLIDQEEEAQRAVEAESQREEAEMHRTEAEMQKELETLVAYAQKYIEDARELYPRMENIHVKQTKYNHGGPWGWEYGIQVLSAEQWRPEVDPVDPLDGIEQLDKKERKKVKKTLEDTNKALDYIRFQLYNKFPKKGVYVHSGSEYKDFYFTLFDHADFHYFS